MNINTTSDAHQHPCLAPLSVRERQVFLAIASGESPAEMAKSIGISVKTVSTYRARLFEKLLLESNQECTVYAMHYGLLSIVIDLPPVEVGSEQRAA